MELQSARSSVMSERNRLTAVDRTTPLSSISRPGSAVDLILDRIGAVHADTRNSIEAQHADVHVGAVHVDLGAVGEAQAETRILLENVIHRLERLETSPVPKFAAGLEMNPSLSNEMTVAPYH